MLRSFTPCGLREASREAKQASREGVRLLHTKVMREAPMHPSPRVTMTRRRLIAAALAAGSLASIGGVRRALAQASGPFALPPLPYPEDALAPVISSTTIGFHYG